MRIAQLSDSHVRAAGKLYKGVVDSNAMLAAAVDAINAFEPPVDLVLHTGDVVDDDDGHEHMPEAYAMAASLLSRLDAPLLAIPGNHDDRPLFRHYFPNPNYHYYPRDATRNDNSSSNSNNLPLHFVCNDCGPIRIIGLDVTVPNHHHGEMTTEAEQWLQDTLAAANAPTSTTTTSSSTSSSSHNEKPTIIMMHQPPFDCGIPSLDQFAFRHANRLANVVQRHQQEQQQQNDQNNHNNIQRIVCGHVHRFMQLTLAYTTVATCTAPSTTTAIALQLDVDPAIQATEASFVEPPAYLLHHWNATRKLLITHHVPIGSFPGPYPFA